MSQQQDTNNNKDKDKDKSIANIPPVLLGDNIPGRQLADMELKKKNLERILDDLKQENKKLLQKQNKVQENKKSKNEHFDQIYQYVCNQNVKHNDYSHNLEYQHKKLLLDNDDQEERLNDEFKEKEEEYKSQVYNLNLDLKKYEQKLEAIHIYQNNEEQLLTEKVDLKHTLVDEKKNKQRELADQEKEKVQATHILSEQMNQKIAETKKQLMNLKKEQISTTNRLTILQNYQLANELDLQSKQTEALLQKNTTLSQSIKKYRKELEISKEIEQELQKKSQQSQNIIKSMQKEITEQESLNQDLEIEKEELQQPAQLDQINQSLKEQQIGDIIGQIEEAESKYQQVLSDLDIIKREQQKLQKQIDKKELKNQCIADIISHCLQSFLTNTTCMYDNISPIIDYEYDEKQLEFIRKTAPEKWTMEDKETLLIYLINKVKKIISSKLLVQYTQNQEKLHVDILLNENLDESEQYVAFDELSELNSQQSQSTTKIKSSNKLSRQSSHQSSFNLPKINGIGYESQNYQSQNNILSSEITGRRLSIQNRYKQNKYSQQRFKNIPIEVSTAVVKGEIRDWGKQASTVPSIPTKSMREQKLKMMF